MDSYWTPGSRFFVSEHFPPEARALMRALEQRGLENSFDWDKSPFASLSDGWQAKRRCQAIEDADVFIAVLTREAHSNIDMFVQIGFALGKDVPVVLVSPFTDPESTFAADTIYFAHPGIQHYKTTVDLLAAIDASNET